MTNLSLRDSCTVLLSSLVNSEAFFVFEVTLLGFSISMRPLTPFGLTCYKMKEKKSFSVLLVREARRDRVKMPFIPLQCHFTILRHENMQNMPQYYTVAQGKIWMENGDHSGKWKS